MTEETVGAPSDAPVVAPAGPAPAVALLQHRVALAAVGFAALGAVFHAVLLHLPAVDDAAISIAYGQSLLSGAGLRLTPRSPPVEGFSNPLWTVLLGLSGPLHLEPLAFSQRLGVAFGALALIFTGLAVPAASGRRVKPLDAVGPLLVAASPNYAYWICSGMESGLHALLLAASVWALVRDFRLRRGLTSGIVLALLALTRPEAPIQILAAATLWLVWLRTERRWPGRPEAMLVGTIVILCGGYLAFRWGYFARLLPNTYYAKLRWDFRPEDYLLGFVRAYPLPLALSGALGILGLVVHSSRRPASLALAFLACNVVFVWVVKGDWMAEWRFLSPFWPLLGILVSAGLCALAVLWSRRQSPSPRAYRWLPAAAGLAVLALAVPVQLARFESAKGNPGFPATFVRDNALRLRRGLQSLGIQQARLGLPDIGGLGLALRGDQILDVAGLADYALAEQGGNFPAMEDYLVSEGLPDVVDAHGPSGHVGSFASLMSHYRPVGGGIWLLKGLEPGHDPRCPGGQVSAALSMDVTTMKNHLDAFIEAGDPGEAVNLVRCVQAHRPAALAELWPVAINAALAADRAEKSGELKRALRLLSLATILSNENAHLRRRTEQMRRRLFPPAANSRAR